MPIGADQVRSRNRFGERNLYIRDGPQTDVPGLTLISEGCPQAHIESARPRRANRTRIREGRAAIGGIGDGVDIEERSIARISIIENIIRARVNLERLVDLIRGVEIE